MNLKIYNRDRLWAFKLKAWKGPCWEYTLSLSFSLLHPHGWIQLRQCYSADELPNIPPRYIHQATFCSPSLITHLKKSRSPLRFFTTIVSSLELPPQTSANIFGYFSHNIRRRGEVYTLTGVQHSLTSLLPGRSHLGMVKCGGETCYWWFLQKKKWSAVNVLFIIVCSSYLSFQYWFHERSGFQNRYFGEALPLYA